MKNHYKMKWLVFPPAMTKVVLPNNLGLNYRFAQG